MAYKTTADLPEDVRNALPADAQGIFLKAFNAEWEANEDDGKAATAGWAAVKDAGFAKGDDGAWAKEADGDHMAQMQKALDLIDQAGDILEGAMEDSKPAAPPAKKPAPPEGGKASADDAQMGSEGGGAKRNRRGRRRGSDGAYPASFDPHSREQMEALAEAMVDDAAFAAQVHKVAEGLRGDLLAGEFVSLAEGALRTDGTAVLKLIQPGWGSSGYYSPELLERDGPKVFPKGTKTYWNHQTEAEEQARPEGDLRDLAGSTLEDARWMGEGPEGPGLYAQTQVFSPYRDLVEELAPHIGVSIRAFGKASEGSAEGKEGTIIEQLTYGQSVDYVTEPGAGGKVLQLFESATRRVKEDAMSDQEKAELKELKEGKARAEEALASRDAKDLVSKALGESKLPEPTQKRLATALTASIKLDGEGKLDEKALTEAVEEAVAEEAKYLAELGAGGVRNLGASGPEGGDKEAREDLEESLAGLGMSEAGAKAAAAVR